MPAAPFTESEEGEVIHAAQTRDFSLGGMCVRTSQPLWPCQRVELTVANQWDSPLAARVAWIRASVASPEAEMGLMFFTPLPSELIEADAENVLLAL
jgi:hypothetical protein